MTIDIRIVLAGLRKVWGECLALNPQPALRDYLIMKSSQAFSAVQAGQVRQTSANNQHTTFESSGDAKVTMPDVVAAYTYLVEIFDIAKAELIATGNAQPADSDIEVQMEGHLRPCTGYTNNWMYIMKCLVLASVLSMTGCKAYDSLIGHPLHVLHEQHENNEAEKKAEAAK